MKIEQISNKRLFSTFMSTSVIHVTNQGIFYICETRFYLPREVAMMVSVVFASREHESIGWLKSF